MWVATELRATQLVCMLKISGAPVSRHVWVCVCLYVCADICRQCLESGQHQVKGARALPKAHCN